MEQAYCEALQFALEYEHNGEEFYRRAVKDTRDRFAKKTLVFLADEEVEHMHKIERFNNHLLGQEEFDLEAECSPTLPGRISGLVADAKANSKLEEPAQSDLAVYDLAMVTEKQGFETYMNYRNDSDDERLQKFFEWLAGEEIVHHKLLAESKKYLEDQSYYFEEAGGWIFG
jgi:rubrerythrin